VDLVLGRSKNDLLKAKLWEIFLSSLKVIPDLAEGIKSTKR